MSTTLLKRGPTDENIAILYVDKYLYICQQIPFTNKPSVFGKVPGKKGTELLAQDTGQNIKV